MKIILALIILTLVAWAITSYIQRDFKWHDVKHISWLFWSGVKSLFKLDFIGVKDSYYWIKIHLSYDSKLVQKDEEEK